MSKTPISTDKEIRAFSDVNVIGEILGDYTIFKKVKSGEEIRILPGEID
ncbi:MAG: cyclophilin-like family protein [bacterium]